NQLREKIGVMFGSPETTTGGRALKFYASVRLDVRRIGRIEQGDRMIGSRTRAKVVKNKVAPPFHEAEFDILYGRGISQTGCILDMGVDANIIKKSGSWFSFGDQRLGQGRDNVRDFLEEEKNQELLETIEEQVRSFYLEDLEEKATTRPGSDVDDLVDADVDAMLGLDL
ncbi:MAG: DNA recombination/repair protein RecA, partial [Corynebacterium humireducens]|nr:DNA recombination/repair protein RecA [Corynebacterium humireducens]